ncbi:gliding motility-associated ABC transporter permease subunit GldF [Croceivirga sp. JEA036]|uniref:gliding motility-associated ABC transporter permease subunit GldF n=1 Tax=Croceivirga sp. JEA036 TaxID=2721162 RepID=UPI00143BFD95|nr:gliding motility-associated ABC transporter permease subunit GldF [Croceivirga sp. JEA036]NJB35412.1 gliding motility-associated ABC transporter permease subunit GldF [Croceivirga sp. JEA036]
MIAILKKEILSFFNSPIGYLIFILFFVLNGLFLWVFKGDFNLLDYGFADLSLFFLLIPWIFLFLIPAITMKSFSEELKMGTLELLLIKPISTKAIVIGKFLGALLLVVLALLPTIVYVLAIGALGSVSNNYDMGMVLGSYFGLFFLAAMYCAIGVFASSLSSSQIFAFILGALLCFVLFYGFQGLATLAENGATQLQIQNFGAQAHFKSIARGIIDTRDLIYFLSITVFFLFMASISIKISNS